MQSTRAARVLGSALEEEMITMTQRSSALSLAAILAIVVVACDETHPTSSTTTPEPKTNTTPAPETTVTSTNATVPGSADVLANATNRDRIRELPDEARITPPKATKLIPGFSVQLRASPWGEPIGALESTGTVTEVARDPKGDYYLVLYTSPADGTKQLGAWVYKDAVENTSWTSQDTAIAPLTGKPASTPAGAKEPTLACAKGQERMKTDHEFCAKTCNDDAACDKGRSEICEGLAFAERAGASKMASARYCMAAPSQMTGHPIN
jgi:hypothetical protein